MYIVFSTQGDLVSKIIRSITNSKFSHVSLRFGGNDEKWMVDSSLKKNGIWPGWWDFSKIIIKILNVLKLQI